MKGILSPINPWHLTHKGDKAGRDKEGNLIKRGRLKKIPNGWRSFVAASVGVNISLSRFQSGFAQTAVANCVYTVPA